MFTGKQTGCQWLAKWAMQQTIGYYLLKALLEISVGYIEHIRPNLKVRSDKKKFGRISLIRSVNPPWRMFLIQPNFFIRPNFGRICNIISKINKYVKKKKNI